MRDSPETARLLGNLCTTNDAATSSQIAHIKETILPDLLRTTDLLDAKVADMRKAIEALNDERLALRNATQYFQKLLSPIRALPNELLSEIIQLASAGSSPTRSNGFLWSFAGVCRTWRSVALSPLMWSHIDLDLFTTPDTREALRLQCVLARSGQVPLHVNIRGTAETLPKSEVFSVLCTESNRWLNVTIHLYAEIDWESLTTAFLPLQGSLRALKSLRLTFDDGDAEFPDGMIIPGFSSCPSLTHFAYFGGRPWVDLPLHQVCDLEVGVRNIDEKPQVFARMISSCTSLRTLKSSGIWTNVVPSVSCCAKVIYTAGLSTLETLEFPQLEMGVVTNGEDYEEGILQSFRSMVHRSGCSQTLTTFRLDQTLFYDDEMAEFLPLLRETTSLIRLDVDGLEVVSEHPDMIYPCDWIGLLLCALASSDFLPHLETFRLVSNIQIHAEELSPGVPVLLEWPTNGRSSLADTLRQRLIGRGTAKLREFVFDIEVTVSNDWSHKPTQADFHNVLSPEEGQELEGLICDDISLTVKLTGSEYSAQGTVKTSHLCIDSSRF